MTLYLPILIGNAIDLIVSPGHVDFPGIRSLLIKIGIIAGCTGLTQWIMNMLNNRITYHIIRDVRQEAFGKLQILPLSYLDAHPSGSILSRIIADVDQFADGLLMGFTQLFTGVVTILGTLLFMLSISWNVKKKYRREAGIIIPQWREMHCEKESHMESSNAVM